MRPLLEVTQHIGTSTAACGDIYIRILLFLIVKTLFDYIVSSRAQQLANARKTNCFVVTLNLNCSYESLTDVANCTRSFWNSPQRTARHG